MKKFLLTALKFILIVSLLLIVVGISFGFVLWRSWPWWVGIFFLIGFAGIWLAVLFVQKLLLRRREQQFVQQVIQQDEAYLKNAASPDQEGLRELQMRWKEAIDTLKASHLSRQGNPLYVLPWYLIIGESGSGKTTAIQSADLSAPFTQAGKVGGISGTRNCDWWFFDKAILIDTAGRYAIPVNEDQDQKEWQKFLSLLVKYRKKEPLNGLVVTIGADKLLNAPAQSLENDGHNIRQRIDELMRSLGKRFPVYVMITKCDLVQGMTQFCGLLPEGCLNQAMGFLNQDLSTDVEFLHARLFETVIQKLRELRLFLLHQGRTTDGKPDPSLLLFPEEFKSLGANLKSFLLAAFKQTPYQETPILRGVYFSSGRQEGTPYSHFLNALGLIKPQEVLPGTSRGLFLHDLFSDILPEDKRLFAPTARSVAWNRLTRNIGVAAWMTIALALCGMLSFSFVNNLATLRKAGHEFSTAIVLRGNLASDVPAMDRFQRAIINVESFNNSWWFPRFGLNNSKEIEARIKEKFCQRFNHDYFSWFDRQLEKDISDFSPATPEATVGRYAAHLVRRINLVKTGLDNRDLAVLTKKTQPSFVLQTGDAKLSERIDDQYLHYLAWQDRPDVLREEISHLQSMLLHILSMPGANLNWLAAWVNADSGLSAVTFKDFWGDPLNGVNDTRVDPAFTGKGKEMIDSLLAETETAVKDPMILSANKQKFSTWYAGTATRAWYDFGLKFPDAAQYITDKTSRMQTAASMADDKSPYFSLLDRMARELTWLQAGEKQQTPAWISLLLQVEKARLIAKGTAAAPAAGSLMNKVAETGKKVIGSLESKTGETEVGQLTGDPLKASAYMRTYQESLAKITPAASSRQIAFQMATEVFKDDPAASKSPFYVGLNQINQMQAELKAPGDEQAMVWKLVAGPLYYLRDFVYGEASCQLNSLWEKDVLVQIQGIDDKLKLSDMLFANNGFASRFLQNTADPFLSRSLEQGFYPKTALGGTIPVKDMFLSFLTEGYKLSNQKPNTTIEDLPEEPLTASPPPPSGEPEGISLARSYHITVNALPTGVNKEAKIIPQSTTLELVCNSGTTRLVNLNYPVHKDFDWEPKNCSELNLQIEAGSQILRYQYKGDYAFLFFLMDFENGTHNFRASDFPNEQQMLNRMDIQTINVSFSFEGIRPLARIIAGQRKQLLALKNQEQEKLSGGGKKDMNVAEALAAWEEKKKQDELAREAKKKALKAQQAQKIEAIKKAWADKFPAIPREISSCSDK